MTGSQSLKVHAGLYAICRLGAGSPAPAWARGEFVSVTSTPNEVSVICGADFVPPAIKAERDWRLIEVIGPFPFSAVGVLASLTEPLATAGISLLAVGTFDTDYVLVKAASLPRTIETLALAGHRVEKE